MSSSEKIEDYRYAGGIDRMPISDVNKGYLRGFVNRKRAHGNRLTSIDNYVYSVCKWMIDAGKDDFKTVTSEEIDEIYFRRLDKIISEGGKKSSLRQHVNNLCVFINYLHGEHAAKKYVKIKIKADKNNKQIDEYVSLEQIKQMRDNAVMAGDYRTAALIMVTFGTGARISELLDAQYKDLEIKQYNAVLNVSGKTGSRRIPFVIGVPELCQWLQYHPMKDAKGELPPDAPIFSTYFTRGNKIKRISRNQAEFLFDKYAKGIPENVKHNPHALRHRMATTLSRKMTVRELNMYFGWSDSTNTALTYMHSSPEELEKSVLEINGIQVYNEQKDSIEFVTQCPSCKMLLPAGTKQCPRCRLILDAVVAAKLDNVLNDIHDNTDIVIDYFKNK